MGRLLSPCMAVLKPNFKPILRFCALISICAIIVTLCAVTITFDVWAQQQRFVSLAPSSTEILFALGLEKEIVGVSQFCNYPAQATNKEKIGTFSQPNIEKILSLKPDIIFCTGLEQAPSIDKLRRLGFTVCISDPTTIEELFESIREIGSLTGRQAAAKRLVSRMRVDIRKIANLFEDIPIGKRQRVFIEIWNSPLMTAGSGSLIDELISSAGGYNMAHDICKPYVSLSTEEVIRRNPDVIILAYMQGGDLSKTIKKRLGWKNISAIKSGRVYNDIDPDVILRPGPRIVEGIKELHRKMYP